MDCERARDKIILATYGELPDDHAVELEQHLGQCAECMHDLDELQHMSGLLRSSTAPEPTPNLLADSRLRLDEALDTEPAFGWLSRLRAVGFAWMRQLQSAPALATLLIAAGFMTGTLAHQYRDAHIPKLPSPVILTEATGGGISSIRGIVQTSNPDIVQVSYSRVIPESVEGSLDDPQIRQLLMMATKAADANGVRGDAVKLLADECRVGHACRPDEDDKGVRRTLLTSLRYDKNPGVRLRALEGLQPFISTDRRVRDAVAESLLHDANAGVRTRAIGMLEPVQSDSSVRQVMRTVSTTDENPYIRTVSTHALEGAASIQ